MSNSMAPSAEWASECFSLKINVYLRHTGFNMHPFGTSISPHILAAVEGFKKHGLEPKLVPADKPEKCDLAVCWGVKKHSAMYSGRQALILERGYVGDRFNWTSLGFDGLNGRANFCNKEVDGARWEILFSQYMYPQHDTDSNSVLVVGQVRGDAALKDVNIDKWYYNTIHKLRQNGFHVIFRYHPLEKIKRPVSADEYHYGELKEAFGRVKFVVTYNSNTAVEAVLFGKKVVSCDVGSMAYDVTDHDVLDVKHHDRKEWAERLAYCQWDLSEIQNGTAWDHLKSGVEA